MLPDENKPLAPFTTFGIGGPARWFVAAHTEQDIAEAAAWAREKDVPLFVLGGGSNLLVADSGFPGLVLHVQLTGIQVEHDAATTMLRAAAGEDWETCVRRSIAENCAGLECLAGIPGTVGGTPVQNVGAYGQEVASTIERVRAFDLHQHRFVEFTATECAFAYRRSRFNTVDRGRYVVTRVDYRLQRDAAPNLQYADVKAYFCHRTAPPSLADVAEAVRTIRRNKGMLIVQGDPDCRSAGSFFKNPVVSPATAQRVREFAERAGIPLRVFPAPDGTVKIPAAWLIEQAGFPRGYALGAAGISSRHTLALINRGNATAAGILALAARIRHAVHDRFGIQLEMEPVQLGF